MVEHIARVLVHFELHELGHECLMIMIAVTRGRDEITLDLFRVLITRIRWRQCITEI